MLYVSFVDHLHYNDCELDLTKSRGNVEVYRNRNRKDRIGSIYIETWIRPLHVIGVCRDLDIEIPPDMRRYEAEFDKKFPLS